MADLVKPYTFSDATDAEAGEVNANFDALYDWVNGQSIDVTAARAFENIPTGPATDPTSDNQFARKKYVDNRYRLIAAQRETLQRDAITSAFYAIPSISKTYTFVSGRSYRFSTKLSIDITSGTGYIVSALDGGAEMLRLAQDNARSAGGLIVTGHSVGSNLAGSKTITLGVRSPFGTLNVNGATIATEFVIEDLGVA